MSEELGIKFEVVSEIPKKTFVKGSKYDELLNGFLKAKNSKVKLHIPPDKKPEYVSAQLKKRKIEGVKISMMAGQVYLEKV